MTKKTMAEIETNTKFMLYPIAHEKGLDDEWYKQFRKNYRNILNKSKKEKELGGKI